MRQYRSPGGYCFGWFPQSALLRNRIGIDFLNSGIDALPDIEVREHIHNAAPVGERSLLQNRHVLQQTVMDNILHNLVYKINLTAVQTGVIEGIRLRPYQLAKAQFYFVEKGNFDRRNYFSGVFFDNLS